MSHLKKNLHLYKTLTAGIYTRTALTFIQMGSSDSVSHFFSFFFLKKVAFIQNLLAFIQELLWHLYNWVVWIA